MFLKMFVVYKAGDMASILFFFFFLSFSFSLSCYGKSDELSCDNVKKSIVFAYI